MKSLCLIMQIVKQLYLKLIPLVTGFRMEQGGGGTHTESHLTLCEGLKMMVVLMCRTEDSCVALGMLVRTSDSYRYSYVFPGTKENLCVSGQVFAHCISLLS